MNAKSQEKFIYYLFINSFILFKKFRTKECL